MDAFAPFEQDEGQDQFCALHRKEQARLQAQEHAQKKAADLQQSLHRCLDGLMRHREGRAFLRWLMQLCRCFEALPPTGQAQADTHNLIFTEGRRFVGISLLRLLQEADPAHLSLLLQQSEEPHGNI